MDPVAILCTVCALVLSGLFVFFGKFFRKRPVCQKSKERMGEVRRPIDNILKDPALIKYEIKDPPARKVTGWQLKLNVWLLYTRYGQHVIAPKVKNGSMGLMGRVYIPEKPTLYPNPPVSPDATDYSKPNESLIRAMIDKSLELKPSSLGFHFPSISDYIRAFRSGACTPTDVAKAVLAAIDQSNSSHPPLRAIVDTNREVVLAMAEASTERWGTGKTLSVLDGVPVAVKGEFDMKPCEFRSGAAFIPELSKLSKGTAVAVEKMTGAGAVIIGVANLQEFGLGLLGSNPNHLHQTTRNPYNPTHYAGGSSSGSAASVAAGLCPIAIGTDGGGSTRAPASVCGVVGIKPTYGLVDATGVLPLTCSVASVGLLGSTVLDTSIALHVVSRETVGDKVPLPLEGLGEQSLDGMTVGVYWEHFEHAHEEIVAQCKQALSQLHSLGATIVKIKLPGESCSSRGLDSLRDAQCSSC